MSDDVDLQKELDLADDKIYSLQAELENLAEENKRLRQNQYKMKATREDLPEQFIGQFARAFGEKFVDKFYGRATPEQVRTVKKGAEAIGTALISRYSPRIDSQTSEDVLGQRSARYLSMTLDLDQQDRHLSMNYYDSYPSSSRYFGQNDAYMINTLAIKRPSTQTIKGDFI